MRAGIYVRISRDAELDGLGVERQETDCRRLAERLKLEVVDLYSDNDISASTSSKKARPGYDRLITDVKAGRIEVVVAYNFSRITRRVREFLDLIDLYEKTGVTFKTCVSGDPDLSTADGRGQAINIANWDQMEAERTAERVRRAHLQMAQNGRFIGPRPFGYNFATDSNGSILTAKNRTLVVNESEAAIVRECVQRVLAGDALWAITNDLNKRGVTTSKGGPWRPQPLRRMLMRWMNAGYRQHQQRKNGKPSGKAELYDAGWPAIVDRDTHERLIAKLTDPSRRSNHDSTAVKYLLTGIAQCGECGGKVVGAKEYTYTIKAPRAGEPGRTKERTYASRYQCSNPGCHKVNRRMDHVDELVEGVVIGILERDGVEVFGGNSSSLDAAETEIASLNAKLALLSDDYTDDVITRQQFERQNARLRERLSAAELRRRKAMPDTTMSAFSDAGVAEAWRSAGIEKQRAVLRRLIEMVGLSITIDKIGPGAFSDSKASRYMGIRIEALPVATERNA